MNRRTLTPFITVLLAACAQSGATSLPPLDGDASTEPDAEVPPDTELPTRLPPEVMDDYVLVSAGTFTMGSPLGEACRHETRETEHQVTITRPFWIHATETTQEEYEATMGFNPSNDVECGPACPVENLTWHMAAAYCNALSPEWGLTSCYVCEGEGVEARCEPDPSYADGIQSCPGFRLPTDAEWEYAYRAGTDTPLYNGEVDAAMCNGPDPNALAIGWFNRNAETDIHEVAKLTPNAWGLYDMAGNVQEWVEDHMSDDLGTADAVDPVNTVPAEFGRGIIRGGSFAHGPENMRAAYRRPNMRDNQGTSLGVRCVVSEMGPE